MNLVHTPFNIAEMGMYSVHPRPFFFKYLILQIPHRNPRAISKSHISLKDTSIFSKTIRDMTVGIEVAQVSTKESIVSTRFSVFDASIISHFNPLAYL